MAEFLYLSSHHPTRSRWRGLNSTARSLNTRCWLLVCFILLCCSGAVRAAPLTPDQVPEPLRPWIDWVQYDQEELTCPFLYNSAKHRCSWPARLQLELDDANGRFSIRQQAYVESWVSLPGDDKHWPQLVAVDDQPARVMERSGKPAVQLTPGTHTISGRFRWDRLPEALTIPSDTGLIALSIKGRRIDFPTIDRKGRLWLQQDGIGRKQSGAADTLEMQVFRRVIDDIPLQVVTHVVLDVAGDQREIVLGRMLLKGFIPLRLESPLPARIEPDGRLLIQARPGHWSIELTTRPPNELNRIALPKSPAPWPADEIWVFDARPDLRLVEVQGVAPIDPSQTNLPARWQQLPAYRVRSGETMRLKVIRRGDPQPEPNNLSLQRTLWLDFDGAGYTINDRISGVMTRGWRLDVQPEIRLGRATLDGRPQLITRRSDSEREGVEVRRGAIRLSADSRFEGDAEQFHAVGWEQDFQNVSAVLHLPPGWRLFSAEGVDNVPNAWLARWTLLDLFLVLIVALAVWRLWDWCWGLVALLTLMLIWHEPEAPRYVWLNILAAIALLRVLPQGAVRTLTTLYRNFALLALILIGIPFMVDEIRFGLYPQLERPWETAAPREERTAALGKGAALTKIEKKARPKPRRQALSMEAEAPAAPDKSELAVSSQSDAAYQSKQSNYADIIDPKAHIQTGPGLPEWQWERIELQWNGPVERRQVVELALLSPTTNMLLNFLRVGLLALLALLMFGVIKNSLCKRSGILGALPYLWILSGLSLPIEDANAQFPDAALLKELKTRLSAPAECLPSCAQIPSLNMKLSPSQLRLLLEIHAQRDVAVPLPAQVDQWLPQQILVDGIEADALFRTPTGQIWLNLAAGRHDVLLAGPLPAQQRVSLPLPLKPHRVLIDSRGWRVDGVHENGVPAAQLQLSRVRDETAGEEPSPGPIAYIIPPFLRVERTLQLGLEWRTKTIVRRLSPTDSAIVLKVPLLHGESVISPNIRVEKRFVLVNMLPRQTTMTWNSVLKKKPEITLTAPKTTEWTEQWRADVSPIWHIETSGIPVIHNADREGIRAPEWRPWPGESVTLKITRPEAVKGRTLTIDSSRLQINPGKRATDTELSLVVRSSQGSQHTLTLPPEARLQSVTINGKTQPIRQSDRSVTLPIKPGSQTIALAWREPTAVTTLFETPPVDLASDSVNSRISVQLGEDRWVLFTGGPRLGPAVLFWGVVLLLAPIAWGLGQLALTPLRHWQWFLLLIGLSQIPLAAGLVIVGWLFAPGLRARDHRSMPDRQFDAMQIGLVLLTLVALPLLFYAVKQGLLGLPEMQIAGNGSSTYHLNWYQDHSQALLPKAWILSVPLLVYRLLMLAWSLWLAYALLGWLRWGWNCFTSDGLWRTIRKEKKSRGKKSDPPEPTKSRERPNREGE
jgi:hypothetical protein